MKQARCQRSILSSLLQKRSHLLLIIKLALVAQVRRKMQLKIWNPCQRKS
nr:hypothetical protein Iba_chr07aCG10250 [Ipomoea batatas]GMD14918.1 hypothetical protein Iba_chr07bCG11050 [Ipomoea batatas]GMD16492.1 hypothetical protein Iba_chr07cCG9920 [Ipomoea batatas]